MINYRNSSKEAQLWSSWLFRFYIVFHRAILRFQVTENDLKSVALIRVALARDTRRSGLTWAYTASARHWLTANATSAASIFEWRSISMTHPDGCSSLKGSYTTTHEQQHKEHARQRKGLDEHVILNILIDHGKTPSRHHVGHSVIALMIRAMAECPEHRLKLSALGVPGAAPQMQCPGSVQSNSRALADGTEEKRLSWPLTRQNPSSSMVG